MHAISSMLAPDRINILFTSIYICTSPTSLTTTTTTTTTSVLNRLTTTTTTGVLNRFTTTLGWENFDPFGFWR